MIKTLYEYWFIQFDFPNEKGKPYRTSGGKMTWNSDLRRDIPDGWEVKTIDGIICNNRTTINPSEMLSGCKYIGLEHIPRKRLIINKSGKPEDVKSQKLCVKKGDILFGKIRPYFHKVSISPWDSICSSDALVLNIIDQDFYAFAVLTLFSDNFVKYSIQISQGSKMPRAEWINLKKYQVAIPKDTRIMKTFNDFVTKILDKMIINIDEMHELESLRDFLLPLLINSQVSFEG